jgi:hypothetical protein
MSKILHLQIIDGFTFNNLKKSQRESQPPSPHQYLFLTNYEEIFLHFFSRNVFSKFFLTKNSRQSSFFVKLADKVVLGLGVLEGFAMLKKHIAR